MQVLYPNLLGFNLYAFLAVDDPEFHLACVRAYNDFLAEFADAEPGRFVPVMSLPFWDIDASLEELDRAAGLGHRGILFANRPEYAGNVPPLRDANCDRLWRAAEEAGLSIDFHTAVDHPDRLLLSEYFRRQMYATFWFEKTSLGDLIAQYPDNVMFETDFPHPTSLSPRPSVNVDPPHKVIESNLAGLPEDIQRKVLSTNAARVYRVTDLELAGAVVH